MRIFDKFDLFLISLRLLRLSAIVEEHYKNVTKLYAAFMLNGFDDQERNLTFVKTAFQVLNSNFLLAVYEASFLSSLQIKYCASLSTRKYFLQAFRSVPGYQTCMCKRGISVCII